MQDGRKAVWSIPYVSVAFFPSLKHNFIAYRSSKVSSRPDCIFEIHQQWQSGFRRVYSNYCCRCSFEAEIIKIGQSFHKMCINKILYFQVSTAIFNAGKKKSRNLLNAPRICVSDAIEYIYYVRFRCSSVHLLNKFQMLYYTYQTLYYEHFRRYIDVSNVIADIF